MVKQCLYLLEFIGKLGKNTVGRQKLVISTSLKEINLFESSEEEAFFLQFLVEKKLVLHKIGIYI